MFLYSFLFEFKCHSHRAGLWGYLQSQLSPKPADCLAMGKSEYEEENIVEKPTLIRRNWNFSFVFGRLQLETVTEALITAPNGSHDAIITFR